MLTHSKVLKSFTETEMLYIQKCCYINTIKSKLLFKFEQFFFKILPKCHIYVLNTNMALNHVTFDLFIGQLPLVAQ